MDILKHLKGLFFRGDQISHTKVWSNIGYAIFSWAIIFKTLNGSASDDLWFIYIVTVALHTTASNLMNKYNFRGMKQNDNS